MNNTNTKISTATIERYDNAAYECYRVNHFEVIPTIRDDNGEDKVLDVLRLAVKKAVLDKLSGKLSLYVYATKQVVDYINTIDEITDIKNKTYNIKYVLYSADGDYKVTILNRAMTLTDISFETFYSKNDAVVIRLDYRYF